MQRQRIVMKAQQTKKAEPPPQEQVQERKEVTPELEALHREEQQRERDFAMQMDAEHVAASRQLEVNGIKAKLAGHLDETLADLGYRRPPEPSPFALVRLIQVFARHFEAEPASDPIYAEAIGSLKQEIEQHYQASSDYLGELQKSLSSRSLFQRLTEFVKDVDQSIEHAQVSIEMPEVNQALQEKMNEIELFLAADWDKNTGRGVLAVHVDEVAEVTVIQVGLAHHGCVYITIPGLLQPEDRALKSLREMFERLAPFVNIVDPMAVINGAHQRLNYNEIFPHTRVMRAPTGNTSRLALNIKEAAKRDRLSQQNTVILNSAPTSLEEYARIFPADKKGEHWGAWGDEATLWQSAAAKNDFDASQQVSQEALLAALSQEKNVIVIVAHCDGESIFMPQPPPEGSVVTADYLLDHRAEISANAPFVYLFSCEAGNLSDLRNFASTLIECGASGVVASQSDVGSAEGRVLLDRLLDEDRGTPPIEDYYQAMDETNFREMEVFLG